MLNEQSVQDIVKEVIVKMSLGEQTLSLIHIFPQIELASGNSNGRSDSSILFVGENPEFFQSFKKRDIIQSFSLRVIIG